MSYRDELLKLGDATGEAVAILVDGYLAGEVSHDDAVMMIALLIARANGRATVLADLSLATYLTDELGDVVPTVGVVPPADDFDRLSRAVVTLLAIDGLTRERGSRLGRSEPLDAAARAYSFAISQSPHVVGWTRKTAPDACKICRDLTGATLPPSVPMYHHTGCSCVPIPVTR